jgi:rhamnogalacturonan acetylesterase
MDLPVVNKAMGGRSARSYTAQGRFQEIAKAISSGDIVVIEFGHNDGGTLNENTDNGRTDCPGTGAKTCRGKFNGEKVIVKTFPAYLTEAGNMFAQKGAKVVFSSMTPNNIWEKESGAYSPSRFTDYARDCAKAVGKGATFVDHGTYVAKAYKLLGKEEVNKMYPQDHTHTNDNGAKVVAEAFVKAVLCAKDPLAEHVKSRDAGGC